MKKIKVNLGKRAYEIIIGAGVIKQLGRYLGKLNLGTDAFIITNQYLKTKYGSKLAQVLRSAGFNLYFKVVADSEKSKSIQTATAVIKDLANFDHRRKVFIIAFGGGVIGDLAGFVASVYKRGTSYIQVPTTLLAQVDSSIGGKTALDLATGKNLVGAFYQPRLVLSEINFLKSLSRKQLQSGLAEVIKYAIIKDQGLFNYLKNNQRKIILAQPLALEKIVGACSLIKAQITSVDEKENLGIRTILNFGHTIGHALEAAGKYQRYNHGEAVALGILVAVELSRRLKLIDGKLADSIASLVKLYGLPGKIKGLSVEKIIQAHYYDKKFSGKENKFVLITGLGKTKIVCKVDLGLIKAAIKKTI